MEAQQPIFKLLKLAPESSRKNPSSSRYWTNKTKKIPWTSKLLACWQKLLAHWFFGSILAATRTWITAPMQSFSVILIGVFWTHHSVSSSIYMYLNWLVSIPAKGHQSMKFIILLLKWCTINEHSFHVKMSQPLIPTTFLHAEYWCHFLIQTPTCCF